MITDLSSCDPMNNIDFVFERCQADVKVALQHLVEPAEVRKNLSVVTGPAKHKGVFTKETFKAGQLKLAPWTNIISKKRRYRRHRPQASFALASSLLQARTTTFAWRRRPPFHLLRRSQGKFRSVLRRRV